MAEHAGWSDLWPGRGLTGSELQLIAENHVRSLDARSDGNEVATSDQVGRASQGTVVRGLALAQLVQGLLWDVGEAPAVLRVEDCRIAGIVDLSGAVISSNVRFARCTFDDEVLLSDATGETLHFDNCAMWEAPKIPDRGSS